MVYDTCPFKSVLDRHMFATFHRITRQTSIFSAYISSKLALNRVMIFKKEEPPNKKHKVIILFNIGK